MGENQNTVACVETSLSQERPTAKERPIIMGAESVRAIIDGRKTQTRRVLKGSTEFKGPYNPAYLEVHRNADGWKNICPYGAPGDQLWVRETWSDCSGSTTPNTSALYAASYGGPSGIAWRSPIFMPRWASRLTLEIVSIRVERVQDISEADAKAEGIAEPAPVHGKWCDPARGREGHWSYRKPYADLWDSINAKRGHGWDKNPWVWVVAFKRIARDRTTPGITTPPAETESLSGFTRPGKEGS